MRKISSLRQADATPSMVLGSQSSNAIAKLAGKTLFQAGSLLGLGDTDVTFVTITTTKGQEILFLGVMVDGQKVLVSLSRNFPKDRLNDTQYLLDCEFRLTHVSVKDENGDAVIDDDGKMVLDESKPYLSFGKPFGLNVTKEEMAFEEENVGATAGS